ncbi:phosphotransferase family protein [Demequina capsici]|uniref:Aminoglycoside phosphotransferase family protein n=1 Tax=Demequina capsici TaxID=3075620 RepID=A0AA96F7U3_9MICO|nr:aminoglycoside phosphotransferase family protein [Demequina sp. OYTSA14]WNM24407.1 aminoglycoside phosphotransferase family protein [Demequina sp. OYTSA14]
MESITKNRQPPRVLRQIIERAYGPDQVPDGDDFAVELGDGYFNIAYVLTLRSGRRVVLKIAPPAHVTVLTCERGIMRNEVAALALIADLTDVPVPAVEHVDVTHELVDADWFVMPLIEGATLAALTDSAALTESAAAGLRRDLGALNRELNGIVGDRFGPLHMPGFGTWREAFASMMEGILRDGERAGVDLGVPYEAIRGELAAHLDVLDEVTEPRFVEWDLWPGNVMVLDGRIVALIDHERALYGDPLIEAGFTGVDLPDFGDPSDFMRGYGLEELTPAEQTRRRLYSAYVLVLMIVETAYRRYPDDGQYHWARGLLSGLMESGGR